MKFRTLVAVGAPCRSCWTKFIGIHTLFTRIQIRLTNWNSLWSFDDVMDTKPDSEFQVNGPALTKLWSLKKVSKPRKVVVVNISNHLVALRILLSEASRNDLDFWHVELAGDCKVAK